MLRKRKLLTILQILLVFILVFNLSIGQEAMNISQNSSTDGNSSNSELSTTTTIPSETSTTLPSEISPTQSTQEKATSTTSTTETTSTSLPSETTTLIPTGEPNISVEIKTKNKITRGESFSVVVTLENVGNATAKNVKFKVKLPNGFSANETEISCGDLEANSSCEREITVFSSFDAELGKTQIEVIAS
ncbi:MAG: NEW3 domain-containing protein, partial [Candidatus Aenigmatarchaeota archaeon]